MASGREKESNVELGTMQYTLEELISSTVRAMPVKEAFQMTNKGLEGLTDFGGNATTSYSGSGVFRNVEHYS